MGVPEHAAVGFGRASAEYERARPGYPPEVLDLLATELGIGPGRVVLDLAAGTGKLTRLLVARGPDVVAVEPVAAMRETLAAVVPEARVVAGTAESLPLTARSVDVATVAQAFHWFRPAEALGELARVLRPGGGLAMVWNERDESVPWVARISEVLASAGAPSYEKELDWAATVAATGRFTPLGSRRFAHAHPLDAESLVARVVSTSYVAVLPDDERARIVDAVRDVAQDLPAEFALPYVSHAYWCRRR